RFHADCSQATRTCLGRYHDVAFGSAAFVNVERDKVLTHPGRPQFGASPAIFQGPIYQGGGLRAQKRQSVAFWEQTKLQYAQTIQVAFQDVSNALVSRQKFEAVRD